MVPWVGKVNGVLQPVVLPIGLQEQEVECES